MRPTVAPRREPGAGRHWSSGNDQTMTAHMALIEPGGEGLRVRRSGSLPLVAFRREVDGDRVPDPAGEYVPVAFLADGDLAVVLPIQDAPRGEDFTFYRLGR